MHIVIDIPEEAYEYFAEGLRYRDDVEMAIMAIVDGTPLPKGHGNLIDENELIDEIVCETVDGRYCDVIYAHSIYDAETIIEADKEDK